MKQEALANGSYQPKQTSGKGTKHLYNDASASNRTSFLSTKLEDDDFTDHLFPATKNQRETLRLHRNTRFKVCDVGMKQHWRSCVMKLDAHVAVVLKVAETMMKMM
ncbi:unnamed protein product [Vicia faba]|uniref:Uncharacterized protein n=1 Tax=Vicia faba TaxID=3906 RepID=A0AAV0ZRI8_VICFA|nr:unnamed protein product [Vicia faba]